MRRPPPRKLALRPVVIVVALGCSGCGSVRTKADAASDGSGADLRPRDSLPADLSREGWRNDQGPDAPRDLLLADLFLPDVTVVNQVTTLAGTGVPGAADGPAAKATFRYPLKIAIDPQGGIYVADYDNARIRYASNHVVSTVAGSTAGYVDGPTSQAKFASPAGVVVDKAGRVIIADAENNVVRAIEKGTVSTIAGDGVMGFVDGPSNTARFNRPTGVAVDSQGRILVADYNNHSIRKIEKGTVSTYAGNGKPGNAVGAIAGAQFNYPHSVKTDKNDAIYVADDYNEVIKVIKQGVVTTVAGSGILGFSDGAAGSAKFNHPVDIAIDDTGRIFVADYFNNRIRVVENNVVTTLAGDGQEGYVDGDLAKALLNHPSGLDVSASGVLVFVDRFNHAIRGVRLK